MSLLVDPQYFLHNLKLNYLRRLPDPIGPHSIAFQSETQERNPYIQLSGLADIQRWPELQVNGSPPEPIQQMNQQQQYSQEPIMMRNRRRNNLNPTSALRYSETIVGPKGSSSSSSALAAGMRVSARKSFRSSKQPIQTNTQQQQQQQQQQQETTHQNPAATALALTEGRSTLTQGVTLNPEDSDEETSHKQQPPPPPAAEQKDESKDRRTISRNPTNTTIKSHRRRISAITFASNPLSFASPPGSIIHLNRSRTRAQRGHSISSIATTNTVISSDLGEHTNPTLNSPTPSHHLRGNSDLASSHNQRNASIEAPDPPSSPYTQPRLDSSSSTSNADVFYSTEHDPDKRMSDMLFTYRPFNDRRSTTQIVGRVELEPAPLLEADNEEDTGDDEDIETDHTDTGTEQGEDDSSFNLEEAVGDDSGTMDDSLSIKSRRRATTKRDDSSMDLIMTPADEAKNALFNNKSLSNNPFATSVVDSSLLNSQSPDVLISIDRAHPTGNQSPPILHRRERRRVNIKMGKLVGPPIIEEDSSVPVVDLDALPKKVALPAATGSRLHHHHHHHHHPRVASAVARPSLPDLRQAIHTTTAAANSKPGHSQEPSSSSSQQEMSSSQTSGPVSSLSPGRARSLTTPVPIPNLELSNPVISKIKANESPAAADPGGESQRTFPINRSGSGPITAPGRVRRRSVLQSAATTTATSRPQSSGGGGTTGHVESCTSKPSQPVAVAGKSGPKKTKRAQLSFQKISLGDSKLTKPVAQKSILTQLLTAQSASSTGENPFRCFYGLLGSKERQALKVTLYYPFSAAPGKPIKTSMKADVCVEEVVGFALWNYVEHKREPKLADIQPRPTGLDLHETFAWCLRLVEDDGEVDDDFPALDRTRPVAKVGSNEFAIVMATEAQAKQNEAAQTQIQRRPSRVLGEPTKRVPRASLEPTGSMNTGATSLLAPSMSGMMGPSGTILDGVGRGHVGSDPLLAGGYSTTGLGVGAMSGGTGTTVYLKVRIPSPGKGVDSINTTINVTMEMYLADVLESLVKKRSLGQVKDWALLVPSSPSIPAHQRDIVVPLDRTVQSLQGVNSLALVKRSQVSSKLLRNTQLNGNMSSQNTNPSASIFKRLSEIPQPKYVSISDLTSSSKSFIIQTKRRGILGKSDRLLTIEDDYVHIAPNHQQQQLHQHPLVPNDPLVSNTTGKVASYHISQIVDCIFRPQAGFKLVVLRDSGEKRYDVEAENSQSAMEIVRHIKGLKEMYHSTRT